MTKQIVKYGLFGGIIVSVFMCIVTYLMKQNPENKPSMVLGLLSMILAFGTIVYGVYLIRRENQNQITIKKAIVAGFMMTLISSTFYVAVWLFIFYNYFPNFMEIYGEMMIRNAKPEDIAKVTNDIKWMKEVYHSPFGIIAMTYMEILPFGCVIAILNGVIQNKLSKIVNE